VLADLNQSSNHHVLIRSFWHPQDAAVSVHTDASK
jgi:hypothetical protein